MIRGPSRVTSPHIRRLQRPNCRMIRKLKRLIIPAKALNDYACTRAYSEDNLNFLSRLGYTMYAGCRNQFYIQNGNIISVEQRFPTRFENFESYHDYLKTVLKKIITNDEKVFIYLSKGYDSVCIASLLHEVIEFPSQVTALCMLKNRLMKDDDGTKIAQQMGYNIVELKQTDCDCKIKTKKDGSVLVITHLNESDKQRLKYFCTPWNSPQDGVMATNDVDFHNSIVFTGFHGDVIWGYSECDDNFERLSHDLGGTSLTEYRIRKGFTHIPVPAMASVMHTDLIKIVNSTEMAPYKLNNGYDRPIPRRIIEQYGGIRRGEFAIEKGAILKVFENYTEQYKNMCLNEMKKDYEKILRN